MSRSPKPLGSDLSVLIPYKRLTELLDAVVELEENRKEVKRLRTEIAAVRNLYSELLDKFNEYQD